MKLRLEDTGEHPAQFNMDWDRVCLEGMDPFGAPVLHLYRWQGNCATHGYFLQPEQVLNLDVVRCGKLALGRRPTGGGVIFHLTDFAFSFFIPRHHPAYSTNTLENYRLINEIVLEALTPFLQVDEQAELLGQDPAPLDPFAQYFCMAKPTKFDVMLGQKKVGGAAQRRTRRGFLHQGSISLAPPDPSFLEKALLPKTRVREAMSMHSYYLIRDHSSNLEDVRQALSSSLVKEASQRL